MGRKISDIELKSLADKVLHGTASEEEFRQLNHWYSHFDDSEVLLVTNESRAELHSKLLNKINKGISETNKPQRKYNSLLWSTAAMIALLVVSIAAIYFVGQDRSINTTQDIVIAFEVKDTKWGQKRTVHLPDGTTVKLNSGSSIKYSSRFDGDNRQVELEGEAFFDVKRDESKPFIIKTNDLNVVVLGTSFNVKSYAEDNQVNVAVKTGKVRVTKGRSDQSMVLLPDEMAIYSQSSSALRQEKIDNKDIVFGWAEGTLVFRNQNFQDVIVTLSRWYDVEFEINQPALFTKKITSNFNNASLREVLETLSHNYDFHYDLKEKIVSIN